MKSEFEEKSYENAFNAELMKSAGRSSQFFSPGQVMESDLGFDTAWMIGATHPFWVAVGQSCRQGMNVSNRTSGNFPSRMYNLFIQYKRSEYIWRSNGSHHTHFNGPYYRFKFDNPQSQLDVLKKLEAAAERIALVYYAAPEFHTLDQLMNAMDANSVVSQSIMARPKDLRSNHTSFNFKTGYPFLLNPEPELVDGTFGGAFRTQMSSVEGELQTLSDSLESMSEAILSIDVWRNVWNQYESFIPVSWLEQETLSGQQLAYHYLAVSSFAALYGLTWTLGSTQSR